MRYLGRRAAATDAEYRSHWDALAAAAPPDEALIWYVLGDSAAVGLGASTVERAYPSLVAAAVGAEIGRPIHVVNLARSGATASQVLSEQIPRLPLADDALVSCVVGGNDVAWPVRFDATGFEAHMRSIANHLPTGSVIGLVPCFGHWPYEGRVRRANESLRRSAAEHELLLADIHSATADPTWRARLAHAADDLFHPNDLGHARWADAVAAAMLAQARRRRLDDPRPGTGVE